ncbi:MAG TPA: hypothetical protein VM925_08305 [Labilithrix sp.]|nr:hypothetical protein [Labilithrix sp.]
MRELFTDLGGCLCLALFIAAAAGCSDEQGGGSGKASRTTTDDETQPKGGAESGLPCEVDALLTAKCQRCHGSPLVAPMPLLTYDDLAAPSKSNPSKSNAAVAAERMASTTAPMPPSGPPTTEPERNAFGAWVTAGLPRRTCGSGP